MTKALEFLFLMSSLLFCGCTKEPEVIKIAVVLNLSGRASNEGFECRNGYTMAFDEINDSLGGIGSHKIELIIKDNSGLKEESAKITTELINNGIKYFLGYITSHECATALQASNSNNVLIFSPSVTGEKFFGVDDNLITCLSNNKYQSALLSKSAFGEIGNGVYTLISDKNKEEFTLTLVNQYRNYLNAYGVEKIYTHSLDNTNSMSFDAIINSIKKEKPQALMVALSAVDLALIVQKVKKFNPMIRVYSPMWAKQPLLIENGGKSLDNGMYFAGVFDLNNTNERFLKFRNGYKKRYKIEPTSFSMLGYECAYILKEAFSKVGFDSPEIVKSYICKMRNYAGLQSRFSFNKYGDPDRPYHLYTIRNNSYLPVENEKNN